MSAWGEADLDTEFYTGSRNAWIPKRATLREILARLEQVYCGTIGAEFAHVSDTDERLWLQDEFQLGRMEQRFSAEERRSLLRHLTAAEGLERYLHTRFVGQKRFSLEGGEALIPLLDELVQESGRGGVEEAIIAMAHRGRLNVLVNVLGKSPADLFSEFEGQSRQDAGSGDVKYHKGFSADLRTPGGNVHVVLAFNPSHLEIVNPVAEGSVRARQERRGDTLGKKVLPILVHGDAAFAGQGVVMETLQMSQTRGFGTGGSIHLVINNQVGFTTSELRDARSTAYCSDVAKMIEAPILHVNADDPEAVIFAARFALRYRQTFRKDVVIDLVCYRRLGHNEADEPAATQPLMYQAIRQQRPVRALYAERLLADGVLQAGDAEQLVEQYRQALDSGRHQLHPSLGMIGNKYTVDWSRYQNVDPQRNSPHRRAGGAAGGAGPQNRPVSGRLHAAPARGAGGGQPRQDALRRTRHGLGLRGDPGLRLAPGRGRRGAHFRPGQRARHLLSPPRRAARSEQRPAATYRCSTSASRSRALRSSTRSCRRRRCSALSTATRAPARTAW